MNKNGLKALFFFLSATLAISFCARASSVTRLFIAGDSSSAVFGPDRYPEFGWGMMLPCALKNAQVLDYAHPGLSAEKFLKSGQMNAMAGQLKAKDTVLIAFGDSSPRDGAATSAHFRDELNQIVAAVRARGAVPVLVTPAVRPSFAHGKLNDPHAAYATVIRQLSEHAHVALIDLDRVSGRWLQNVGPKNAGQYYLTEQNTLPWRTGNYGSGSTGAESGTYLPWRRGYQDDTRLNELGARILANMLADQMARLPIPPASHVLINTPSLTRLVPVGSAACE